MHLTAHTWEELMGLLYADTWDETLRRHRSKYVFRGITKHRYLLQPSLTLLGEHFAEVEELLLADLQHYGHHETAPGTSIWNWLTIGQHHGLPTRLLDWTYSPYVALHFATRDLGPERPADDAVVWCVNYKETNAVVPGVLLDKLAEFRKDVFSAQTLDDVVGSLSAFDRLAPEPFVVFMEPPSIDPRIVSQVALFSIMSRPERADGRMALDAWLEDQARRRPADAAPLYRKIRIPADLKWEVRDKLDQANINERLLLPGLDGLCAWLRRHYTRRG